MRPFRLTPAAEDDLFAIWRFIAPDNIQAADRLQAELLAACQRVADKPDLGHWRRDLTDKPARFFTVRQTYLIVYELIGICFLRARWAQRCAGEWSL